VIPLKYREYVPLALFALLIVFSFFIIKPFLLAIFFGALLAYVFSPVYRFLLRKLKNQTFTALLICIVVLILILVPSFFFTQALVKESYTLFILLKQKLAVGLFVGCENSLCSALGDFGNDPTIQFQLQEGIKSITNWIVQKGSNILVSLPQIALNLFVLLFTMFYFLKDGKSLVQGLSQFLNIEEEKKYLQIMKRLREIFHGVVYGYLVVALMQGALGALGFFIFGVSSPLFWGLVMALLALIPFLGTGFVWVPATLIFLFDGLFTNSPNLLLRGIGLFFYGLIFVSSLDNIVRPKLIGQKAKIHPAIIMLGIFGGLLLFGPLGVIVGPLVLSLAVVFTDIYLKKY
jgi:predicted PurR-regulated permease PerM